MRFTKIWPKIVITTLVAMLAVTASSAQQGGDAQERDLQFEQEILDRLAEISPEAAPVFQQATRDMDANDLAAAKRGFERVLELAPGFPDAERRLSYVEGELGNRQAALEHARRALQADDSPFNHTALAVALLSMEDSKSTGEALTHAKQAVAGLPDDLLSVQVLLWAAAANNDMQTVRQASADLVRLAPEAPLGHYFAGLVAADRGRWEEAESELLLSQRLGMDPADVQQALNQGISQRANEQRWLRAGGYALAGWAGGGVSLFIAGALLSRVTMAAVRRRQASAPAATGRVERLIRAVYRIIIALTSLFFYASIPLLILIVIGGALGIVYLFFALGRIPVQLMIILGFATLYTLIAIVRSVFVRVREAEPGRALPRAEAPQLWAVTEAVAQRLETRPIDAIYLTPASEIAVTERGSLLKKLRGAGQRCLILGLGVLSGMSQGQFEAILAHEYGHFNNRDTAGGDLARQVQVSVFRMAYSLAASGQARWYNPAWLFVNGFYRLFLRITRGASRLQEIAADRHAVLAYGAGNFIDGLMHVVRQSLVFDWQVINEVEQARQSRRRLSNLYTLALPDSMEFHKDFDKKLEEVIGQPTSPYDSHPSVKDRIELARQIEAMGSGGWKLTLVWDLLPNAEVLKNEMTGIVQSNVERT